MLVRGASGAGKSTLALRCLEAGFRLVADDRVTVWCSGGRPFGKAPSPLAGLMEIRSVGIVSDVGLVCCEVVMVVDLVSAPQRLPDPMVAEVADVTLPLLQLAIQDPDLPLKLRAALRRHL